MPRLSADSVVFEAALVKVPDDWDEQGEFWRSVDEQFLPNDLRRRLQDNGFRSGILGVQLPDLLRGYLDSATNPAELLATEEPPAENDLFSHQQRLQMRAGKAKRVNVTTTSEGSDVVLFNEDGAIRAMQFNKSLGMLELTSSPLGDGRARLTVTPAIEHGDVRQQWVSGQGTFVLDVNRPRESFDALAFTAVLSPGQTVLITATPQVKGIGGRFFQLPDGKQRSILLVRLAQTQLDDLFTPSRTLEPVAARSAE